MRNVIKGVSFLLVTLLCCALLGKWLPFNTTTPFFKWYAPYEVQLLLEVIAISVAGLFVWKMVTQKSVLMNKERFTWLKSDDFTKQKRKFLIVYAVLNIVVIILFQAQPGWDYRTVVYDSGVLLHQGGIGIREYIMQYPNNLAYILCVMPIVWIFGSDMTVQICLCLNGVLLLITFSLFIDIVYKLSKSMKRLRYAAYTFILFLPLVYYNQTFYTDTIILPFVFGGIYLLFDADGGLSTNKRNLYSGFILLIIAALFKPSVIVLIVAVSLLCLIFFQKWNKLYVFVSVGSLFSIKGILFLLISIWSIFYPPLYNKTVSDVGFPESAWICMAQNDEARGDYNEDDAKTAYDMYRNPNVSKKEMDLVMKTCVQNRLAGRGLLGNGAFFFRKFAFSWSDPSYYAVYNLGLISTPLGEKKTYSDAMTFDRNSSITKLNVYLEQGGLAVVHYMYLDIFQNILYLSAIGVTIQQFWKRKVMPNAFLQFVMFSTLGYGLFHLIWEARSRYLLTIALFLIMYVCIYVQPFERKKIRKKP